MKGYGNLSVKSNLYLEVKSRNVDWDCWCDNLKASIPVRLGLVFGSQVSRVYFTPHGGQFFSFLKVPILKCSAENQNEVSLKHEINKKKCFIIGVSASGTLQGTRNTSLHFTVSS